MFSGSCQVVEQNDGFGRDCRRTLIALCAGALAKQVERGAQDDQDSRGGMVSPVVKYVVRDVERIIEIHVTRLMGFEDGEDGDGMLTPQ